jgi:hypothetical protein
MDTNQAYTLIQNLERIADSLDRIGDVLTEIRDQRRPTAATAPAQLFGYRSGQETLPTETQYRFAVALLRGEITDDSVRLMPSVAWSIAREIIERFMREHGYRCELGQQCPDYVEGHDHAHTKDLLMNVIAPHPGVGR